jgi:hypothetical protein
MTSQGKAEGKPPSEAGVRIDADFCHAVFRGSSIPGWPILVLLDIQKAALEDLRRYVTKGKDGASWKNPWLQQEFVVRAALVEEPPVPTEGAKPVTEEDAASAAMYLLERFPDIVHWSALRSVTRDVMVRLDEEDESKFLVILPPEITKKLADLPETEREVKAKELALGFECPLTATGTADTPTGKQAFAVTLRFAVRPLVLNVKESQTFWPVQIGLDFTEGNPSAWSEEDRGVLWSSFAKAIEDLAAPYLKELRDAGQPRPEVPKPSRVHAVRPEDFPVPGSYVRPIFGLSKRKQDLPLLVQFHEPQTPLNWAVGLALFSLTDEDRVRTGDWQEARIADLQDRVFCLTERDAPRRGDHRTDILAEVVKLHTTRNWYYEVDTVRYGRAWTKRARIGSQYAIPELQLVFLDTKTGNRAFPTDTALRALKVPLEVKGRRVYQPDGKDIPALPKGRWKLEAIRWRWVQSFNDDLLLTPALEESGRRKGLAKKTTTGKTLRKGYLLRVADNVFTALHRLRQEGPRSLYACRLLVMLAHNLNRTEEGIAADRVFRMLGIGEDYADKTHEEPEDLVARAVLRLKQRDIRALLPGSDEYPRTDPNTDRRKGPYYRLVRSLDYTPRTGIASKEDALAIEAEYAAEVTAPAQPAQPDAQPKAVQAVLPGLEAPPAPPIPSGPDIRAAREAAGLNLRRFAESVGGGSFNTWARYERGEPIRAATIKPDTWQRVRDFVAQHRPKGDA